MFFKKKPKVYSNLELAMVLDATAIFGVTHGTDVRELPDSRPSVNNQFSAPGRQLCWTKIMRSKNDTTEITCEYSLDAQGVWRLSGRAFVHITAPNTDIKMHSTLLSCGMFAVWRQGRSEFGSFYVGYGAGNRTRMSINEFMKFNGGLPPL